MLIHYISTLTGLAGLGVLTVSGLKQDHFYIARKAVFCTLPPLASFRLRIKVLIHSLEQDESDCMDFISPPRRANSNQSKGESKAHRQGSNLHSSKVILTAEKADPLLRAASCN